MEPCYLMDRGAATQKEKDLSQEHTVSTQWSLGEAQQWGCAHSPHPEPQPLVVFLELEGGLPLQ